MFSWLFCTDCSFSSSTVPDQMWQQNPPAPLSLLKQWLECKDQIKGSHSSAQWISQAARETPVFSSRLKLDNGNRWIFFPGQRPTSIVLKRSLPYFNSFGGRRFLYLEPQPASCLDSILGENLRGWDQGTGKLMISVLGKRWGWRRDGLLRNTQTRTSFHIYCRNGWRRGEI